MSKKCDHTFLSNQPGTSQFQRMKAALLPENFNLNEFSIEQWMQFAYSLAQELNYFSVEDSENPLGNWQDFFLKEDEIGEFVASLEKEANVTPHLTLFITFIKLLEFTKKRFNELTKRHLDFYYEQILQISKKEAVVDQVHILFELAKNAEENLIEESTLAEAGKDAEGKRMQYATEEEYVANKTTVSYLKSLYHHRKKGSLNPLEKNGFSYAPMVNSLDGKGEDFKEDSSWYPFGYPKHFKAETSLPTPNLGFAVSAPTLKLSEGRRLVRFKFTLKKKLSAAYTNTLLEKIKVYATGAKGWIGPFTPLADIEGGYKSFASNKTIQLALEIDPTQEAIQAFDPEIHEATFHTTDPVFKFEIDVATTNDTLGYKFYTEVMEKVLLKSEILVKVEGATNLSLENDIGSIVPSKPFHPFGTQPMKRSAFYVGHDELFSKNWKNLSINASWLNTPDSFKEHYLGYRKDNQSLNLSPQRYYETLYFEYDNSSKVYIDNTGTAEIKKLTDSSFNIYVDGDDYFKAKVTLPDEDTIKTIDNQFELFQKSVDTYHFQLNVNNSNLTTGKNGPLKLSLNQSFLHKLFPKVYALALSAEDDTIIPNEPYTPLIEQISLNYEASQERVFGNNTSSTEGLNALELFHLHPFGQKTNTETLVAKYCEGGELYLGLEQAHELQNVSILFQMLEGTENPLTPSFSIDEKIEWAVLINNRWETLDSNHLLGDTTDNFLKTGIVTVKIPKQANEDNTLFEEKAVWLRAKTNKNFDAVCKAIGVHAQVVKATFLNNDNDLSHLINGLPSGTIAKLTERDALVKKITQPYHSFGGRAKETNDHYYRRVSERIRHRDRAINLWDYEHLILEAFEDVYKVKCLNHTKENNFHAPGEVSLVVIPDIVNNNAFDIFQPRLSTAKRNEIQAFINQKNSFFVTAKVINPDYEEIQITTDVKFHRGYDENFYRGVLEEDIKKYLSPWAYEETKGLNFGITFHRSKITDYIEQLPYVDFLSDLKVWHRITPFSVYEEQVNVIPSNPKAILVSAKLHQVNPIASKCDAPESKAKKPCLS